MKTTYAMTVLMGLASVMLSGCGTLSRSQDTTEVKSIPALKVDAASSQARCGNAPSYELGGKTYQVLTTARGYREQGTASWYGAEVDGTETAGCETFDMNAFSAAHRTLPLPSFVRVTHAETGKSVIVRVNDRGPFDSSATIQLSLAAANALGMTQQAEPVAVRIEGIDPDQSSTTVATKSQQRVQTKVKETPQQKKAIETAKKSGKSFYVVVNNFASQQESLDMFVRLTAVGLRKTEMATAQQNGRNVYQVRIGPLYTQDQIDNVKDTLASNGLATFRVVSIDQ